MLHVGSLSQGLGADGPDRLLGGCWTIQQYTVSGSRGWVLGEWVSAGLLILLSGAYCVIVPA